METELKMSLNGLKNQKNQSIIQPYVQDVQVQNVYGHGVHDLWQVFAKLEIVNL